MKKMKTETIKSIVKFRDDRNWRQFHTPKALAISLSLEASELLEIFQWTSSEQVDAEKVPYLEEELADILIYSVLLADIIDADIDKIIETKLRKNAEKYPVEKSYGRKDKYNQL